MTLAVAEALNPNKQTIRYNKGPLYIIWPPDVPK